MLHKLLVLILAFVVTETAMGQSSDVTNLLNEYLLVNSQLRTIYQKIGAGQVVAQVNTRQLAKFDEVITERYRATTSSGSSWSASYGLNWAGSSAHSSHSSGYDTSKTVAANPSAAAEFGVDERRDFGKLQNHLRAYMSKNEGAIIQMLLLGARASYLAYQLELQGLKLHEGELTDTVEMVSNVYFLGVQNINRCVRINHPGSTQSSRTTASAGFAVHAGLWAHFASSSYYSHSQSLERVSHSVTTCDASENWARIDTSSSTQTVSVQFLSGLMREWVGALSRHRVITKQVPTFNLTWNSPFFK